MKCIMNAVRFFQKYLRFFLAWGLACIFVTNTLSAQTEADSDSQIKRVDNYIIKELPKSGVPGAAVALIDGGKTSFSRGYGDANSSGARVNADTPFQIASLSKSFTALCILQLVDEERLHLDSPVVNYLPGFRTRIKALSDQITVRHLLMHRSGLSTLDGNRYQGSRYRGADALNNATARLRKAPLDDHPGVAFAYSNANYAVLGHLLESIEQASFETIVTKRVFDPLGMTNSYVQISDDGIEIEAHGYRHWFGFTIEQPFTAGRMMGPAGGVVSSANDMANYIAAMSDAETDLISIEMRSEMFLGKLAWGDTYYGMGWGVRQDEQEEFISHEGLNPGFKSVAGFYKGRGTGVVVLTNRSSSLSDNFALSVLDVAQSRPPRPYAPTILAIGTLLGVLGSALMLCCGALVSLRLLFRRRSDIDEAHGIARKVIVPFNFLAIAYGLLFLAPALNGMTLPSIYTFYPDLAVCLGIGGASAMLLFCVSILKSILHRAQNGKV